MVSKEKYKTDRRDLVKGVFEKRNERKELVKKIEESKDHKNLPDGRIMSGIYVAAAKMEREYMTLVEANQC